MFPTPWTVDVLPFAPTVDAYGNDTDSWGAPVPRPVYGWAPAGTDEVGGDRRSVTADLDLYAPPGFVCGTQDKVTVLGRVYRVEGEIESFDFGPFGFRPGVRVGLRIATG